MIKLGAPRTKEHLLRLAEHFQRRLQETKPWISIDLENYKGGKYKLNYYCSKHDFNGVASGAALIKSYGCPTCQKEGHIYNTDEYKESRSSLEFDNFKLKAKEIHADKYQYFDYLNSRTKIKIFCNKHQSYFYQLPSAHLQGQNCPECGKESFAVSAGMGDKGFEERWLAKNQNKNLSYIKGTFTKFNEPVAFNCTIHGRISINSGRDLSNVCKLCVKEDSRKKFEEKFIETSSRLYPDQFDYSKLDYQGNRSAVTLICKYHGEFKVSPMHHISELGHGSGCKQCAKLLWGRWSPKTLKKNEEYFRKEACLVYLIKIGDLHKIGISKNIKSRFNQFKLESGLDPELLGFYQSNTFKSSEIEHHLSKLYKAKRLDHPIRFGGYTECYDFSEQDISDVLSFFNKADSW